VVFRSAAKNSPARLQMNSPTFVYGALRSGTTLLKLMLDSHEDISCPGEVDFILDYLKKEDGAEWSYDLDRLSLDFGFQDSNLNICELPDARQIALDFVNQLRKRARGLLVLNIHRNLDKAVELFPSAKFIHLVRDPRDVARSCIDMGWAGTAYFSVEQWLGTERSWDRLLPQLKTRSTMELAYEELILNTEEQLRRVCSFIGVAYSSSMFSYSDSSTYEAPNSSAINQWKTKLTPREVALVETRVKDMLLGRNYRLSGFPLTLPSWEERLRLVLKNKSYVWKFACRRYGYFNFIMEQVTRRFAKPLNRIFLERINETIRKHLKR